MFVALPTGYGIILFYCCLPYASDHLRSFNKQSIVLVISPLVALIRDQMAVYLSKGLATVYVSLEPRPSTQIFLQPSKNLCEACSVGSRLGIETAGC